MVHIPHLLADHGPLPSPPTKNLYFASQELRAVLYFFGMIYAFAGVRCLRPAVYTFSRQGVVFEHFINVKTTNLIVQQTLCLLGFLLLILTSPSQLPLLSP